MRGAIRRRHEFYGFAETIAFATLTAQVGAQLLLPDHRRHARARASKAARTTASLSDAFLQMRVSVVSMLTRSAITSPSLWLSRIASESRAKDRPTPDRTSASIEGSWSTSA